MTRRRGETKLLRIQSLAGTRRKRGRAGTRKGGTRSRLWNLDCEIRVPLYMVLYMARYATIKSKSVDIHLLLHAAVTADCRSKFW